MKVLFVPTLHYLTDPLYQKVFPELKDLAEIHYIISSESMFLKLNINHKLKIPNYVNTLESSFKPNTMSGRLLKDSFNSLRYSYSLISDIRKIKPDVIVFGTDQTPLVKIIDSKFPTLPKVILQSALINYTKVSSETQKKWYKKLGRKLLNPLIYPIAFKQVVYGLANPDHHIFLFGEKSLRILAGKKDPSKLHLTGCPILEESPRAKNPEYIVIYFPVSSRGQEEKESYEDVLYLMEHYPNEKYVLKKHPQSNQKDYEDFAEKTTHLNIQNLDLDLAEAKSLIKGIVSFYSFGDFPLLLNKIPLIHHRRLKYEILDYWFSGLDVPQSNEKEGLIKNFQYLLDQRVNSENINSYLSDMFIEVGTRSAKLIAEELIKIATIKG